MDLEYKTWCFNCSGEIGEKDEIYCNSCMESLKKENEELQDKIRELEGMLEDHYT